MAYIKAPYIQGTFMEAYTPKTGRITSPMTASNNAGVAQKLESALIYLPASVSVTFRDYGGNQSTATLPAGLFSVAATEISAAGGSVFIVHDGLLSVTEPQA